jgi:hypothetical protein
MSRIMRALARLLFLSSPAALIGCFGNFTPVTRVQEAAHELTTAARFGRMDVALERVSRNAREEFMKHHAAWGNAVRVVDSEIQGMTLRDKEHADVFVTVGWQRIQETEMRVTYLAQHWRDHRGSWLLEREERTAGDVGLLGEAITVVRPPAGDNLQFDSITIR